MTEFIMPAVCGLCVLGGFAIAVLFTRERRIQRALRQAPVVPIAQVRDGAVVKIAGIVRYGARTVTSPLTGRTCAFYSVVVESTNQTPASEIIREDGGVDFYVEDASGVALVRIRDVAPSAALVDDREFITTPIDGDATIEQFMTARGHSIHGRVFLKSLRAREGVLEAGERVAVGGLARWMPDPDAAGGNYRETPKRLVLEASESLPLFLSDDPSTL